MVVQMENDGAKLIALHGQVRAVARAGVRRCHPEKWSEA